MRHDEVEFRQRRAAQRARARAWREIWTGLSLLAVGVVITAGTFLLAKTHHLGGRYFIVLSPIIIGLVVVVQGLRALARAPKMPNAPWSRSATAPEVEHGWYPDPSDPGHERWWDGVGWGHQVRTTEPPGEASGA